MLTFCADIYVMSGSRFIIGKQRKSTFYRTLVPTPRKMIVFRITKTILSVTHDAAQELFLLLVPEWSQWRAKATWLLATEHHAQIERYNYSETTHPQ